jgi:hypothetical protein
VFTFYLDFQVDGQNLKHEVEIDNEERIETSVVEALEKFKEVLAQLGYEMETGLGNYTLRLAKKNGKPKTDMPCTCALEQPSTSSSSSRRSRCTAQPSRSTTPPASSSRSAETTQGAKRWAKPLLSSRWGPKFKRRSLGNRR